MVLILVRNCRQQDFAPYATKCIKIGPSEWAILILCSVDEFMNGAVHLLRILDIIKYLGFSFYLLFKDTEFKP
jgi:hypothetical protein